MIQVSFIPTHVLIDRQGRIRRMHVWLQDWQQLETWRVLEPLVAAP